MSKPRSIRLRERVLKGGEFGQAWPVSRTVVINPKANKTDRDRLDTLIHEALHLELYDLDETAVERTAGAITALLWRDGWRRGQSAG